MRKKDFLDFLISKEQVPQETSDNVKAYIHIALRPGAYLGKFYAANLLGGLMTLIICPQYGFGPYGGSQGFFHYIMSFGPIWCGLFCAGVFFIGANTLSLVVSTPTERKWVAKHKNSVVLPWVTFLFFVGMLVEGEAPGGIHRHQELSYYLSWYFSAVLLTFLIFDFIGKVRPARP